MYENLAMVEKRTNSNQKGDVLLKAANFQATTMVWWLFAFPCTSSISPSSNFRDIDQNYDWVWSPTVIVKKYQHHEKDNAKYFLGFKHSLMMLMSIMMSPIPTNGDAGREGDDQNDFGGAWVPCAFYNVILITHFLN